MSQIKKVLMICLDNICCSPIAEAVFENEINKRGLKNQWKVESAVIMGYHTGKMPDDRVVSTLKNNGIIRCFDKARQITQDDFNKFDWILGMDNATIQDLNNQKPKKCWAKVELLGNYHNPPGEIIIKNFGDGNAEFQKAYELCLECVIAFLNKHAII